MGRSKVRVAAALPTEWTALLDLEELGSCVVVSEGGGALGTTQSKVERPPLLSSPPLLTPNSLPTGGGPRREAGGGGTRYLLKETKRHIKHVSACLREL